MRGKDCITHRSSTERQGRDNRSLGSDSAQMQTDRMQRSFVLDRTLRRMSNLVLDISPSVIVKKFLLRICVRDVVSVLLAL